MAVVDLEVSFYYCAALAVLHTAAINESKSKRECNVEIQGLRAMQLKCCHDIERTLHSIKRLLLFMLIKNYSSENA